MHDGSAPAWRQIIERHHTALADDLTAQFQSELDSRLAEEQLRIKEENARQLVEAQVLSDVRVAQAVSAERGRLETELSEKLAEVRAQTANEVDRVSDDARRRLAESLNQTLRRIRQTSAEHEALQLLLEDTSPFAEHAVVLLVENNQASIAAWRELPLREEEEDGEPIALSEAAAIASCVESRDPVIALATPSEVSSALAVALNATGQNKVYLFPVIARQHTVAVLIVNGDVKPAPTEMLCEAVGIRLEAFETGVPAPAMPLPLAAAASGPAPLVQISPSKRPVAATPASWSGLTPEEQTIHLKAQRTARVRVAQIRISESDALRKGVQTADIYGALRRSIDVAREEYRKMYVLQSPTMVDYLHLELTRSLAHDDAHLLGQHYPGPIV